VDSFYDIQLGPRTQLVPPILGSIQAWCATDRGERVTLVRSRPDIIAEHLGGNLYFSNVPKLADDLTEMARTPRLPGELALREVRWVDGNRIPLGVFDPVDGIVIRDVLGYVRCEAPLAAAVALLVVRSYKAASTPNVVTARGELVCRLLPHFAKIYRSEMPSFTGCEPEISSYGRIYEGRKLFAQLTEGPAPALPDDDSLAAEEAFERELADTARGIDAGPALAHLLATRYGVASR
jgi:hypothetical protein